jgi:hypothetical protein
VINVIIIKPEKIMPTRKIIALSLILCLALGFFVETVRAELCFCGKNPKNLIQDNAGSKSTSIRQSLSPDYSCKNCKLEKGNTFKVAYYSPKTSKIRTFTIFINSNGYNYPSIELSQNILSFSSDHRIIWSSPIYLNNLSIRC